jgi:hypothetical protein
MSRLTSPRTAVRCAACVLGLLLTACDLTAPLRTLDRPPPAWSLQPARDSVFLAPGDTARVGVAVLDRQGRRLSDRTVRFSSGDPSVVTVSDSGTVRARARGVAEVLATVEGLRAIIVVLVE